MDRSWAGWLTRWTDAGLLDADTAARIRAFEGDAADVHRLRWPILIALGFGGVMICGGILLFVAANWDVLSPAVRFSLVLLLVATFHVAGAFSAERFPAMAETMHAVGTVALGSGIALAGQIFNLEEHWPGGIMLWALGAGLAWAVLRYPSLAGLFAVFGPAWLIGEWMVATERVNVDAAAWPVGCGVLLLGLSYFTGIGPGKAGRTRTVLLWLGGLTLVASSVGLVMLRWDRDSLRGLGLPSTLQALGWLVAIGSPLLVAGWLRRIDAWPNGLAAVWVLLLFFMRGLSNAMPLYAWWALGAVGLAAWGVRDRRSERINVGALYFGATVLAFYFSQVMDKLGRSASLVGLGLLFLGGGWALEQARRRLVRQSREVS